MIQSIDALDCGSKAFGDNLPYTISKAISSFNLGWNEKGDNDKQFDIAVEFAKKILEREINYVIGIERARDIVMRAIEFRKDWRVVILDKFVPWVETVVNNSNALFVVFPSEIGEWMVQCVPVSTESFDKRKELPKAWAGLRDEEFQKVSGVSDGIFCHLNLFICGARSFEGAIKLVELANG